MKLLAGFLGFIGTALESLFFFLLGASTLGDFPLEWWQVWLPFIVGLPISIIAVIMERVANERVNTYNW